MPITLDELSATVLPEAPGIISLLQQDRISMKQVNRLILETARALGFDVRGSTIIEPAGVEYEATTELAGCPHRCLRVQRLSCECVYCGKRWLVAAPMTKTDE